MASYKNSAWRTKELEEAIRGIATLISPHVLPDSDPLYAKVMRITDTVLSGGTLQQANVTVTKRNLMTGKDIEVPLGTSLCCDPSSETFWSM